MTNAYEPIRKHITVACPQERAFRVFTENMNMWWPKEHHIGSSPLKLVTLEGKPGGRFFEIGEDGWKVRSRRAWTSSIATASVSAQLPAACASNS